MSASMSPPAIRMYHPGELDPDRLGPCRFALPDQAQSQTVDERHRVLALDNAFDATRYLEAKLPLPSFEPAGPRPALFFDPASMRAGIVTCGGLCPGQNDVIRSIVLTLKYAYGVERVLGFRYGYNGLAREPFREPLELNQEIVAGIHRSGGTLLASSRGTPTAEAMVQTLIDRGVDVLFAVGGDGTMRGARALAEEIKRQGRHIAVVGVPKTIDNDLLWVARSFGFATSVDEARRAIAAANIEANCVWNGIGLVKLMGRHSGFIAAHASLANSDVNFCLIPEVPFQLGGSAGFLAALERRLLDRQHAVIVVAEGAGQEMLHGVGELERDASGNIKLKDVGVFLKERIAEYLRERNIAATIKYIDPSYMLRSVPANSLDAEYCLMLGQYAVHAAMAGRTNVLIGYWNQRFTHVPISATVEARKHVDPEGGIWRAVLQATGQPNMNAYSEPV